MDPKSPDFVVVGGGTVGAAIAYGLARNGLSVMLLDEGDIAHRAARGNFGNIWVQGKGHNNPAYADLTRAAANSWASYANELQAETEIDLHFRRPGAFYLCFTHEDFQKRTAMMRAIDRAASVSSPFEILDGSELRKRLAGVGPSIVGATFSPDDGTANPLHLLRALILAFQRRGGAYRPRCKLLSFRPEGMGYTLETTDGVTAGSRIVLAAGLANKELAAIAGINAPVRPVRGQVLVTEKLAPFLDYGTNFIRQTVEGGCIIGESSEEAGFDDGTTLPILRETARRAAQAFPILKHARVVRSWGALRIMTPDGIPVYEESSQLPGVYAVSVHSGVTLAPFHSSALVEKLIQGRLGGDLAPFSSRRFNVQKA
ncbi:FAD-dependent oxidoreductase [Chelativorans sp. Marseille-P2723]|uniref:NAD(P)/FAD-dependent oxidoreductase n=1 Tax=Chelativorans sp. Marseille-P2723 TaxID=2709133 RepID=UPI00156E74CF|nr:FAD-dependent oxidoreductase [Chelativorans sp. Marseille-P2723]